MRLNNVTIACACIIAVLLGVIFYMYQQKGKTSENMDSTAPGPVVAPVHAPASNSPAFVLFWAEWCPHCKDVVPIWKQLKEGAKGNVQILDMESKNPAMMAHKIPGFPTIRFFPEGLENGAVHTDYTGPRTLEGFVQFLSSQ